MGLDIVEMVLAVERAFGIDLPDPELAPVRTVGEFEASWRTASGWSGPMRAGGCMRG